MHSRASSYLFALSLACLSGCGDTTPQRARPTAVTLPPRAAPAPLTQAPAAVPTVEPAVQTSVWRGVPHWTQQTHAEPILPTAASTLVSYHLTAQGARLGAANGASLWRADRAIFFRLDNEEPSSRWLLFDPASLALVPVDRLRDPESGGGFTTTIVRALPNPTGGSDIYHFTATVNALGELSVSTPQRLTRSGSQAGRGDCREPLIMPMHNAVVFRRQEANGIWRLFQVDLAGTNEQPLLTEQSWQVRQLRQLDAATLLIAANPDGYFARYRLKIDDPQLRPWRPSSSGGMASLATSPTVAAGGNYFLSTLATSEGAVPALMRQPEIYSQEQIFALVRAHNPELHRLRERGIPDPDYLQREQDSLALAAMFMADQRHQSVAAERWQAAAQQWQQTERDEVTLTRDQALARRAAFEQSRHAARHSRAAAQAAGQRLRQLCGLGDGPPLRLAVSEQLDWPQYTPLPVDELQSLAILNHPQLQQATSYSTDTTSDAQTAIVHETVHQINEAHVDFTNQQQQLSAAFQDELRFLETLRKSRLAAMFGTSSILPEPRVATAEYLMSQAARWQQQAQFDKAVIGMHHSAWLTNALSNDLDKWSQRSQQRRQIGRLYVDAQWSSLADPSWLQNRHRTVIWHAGQLTLNAPSSESSIHALGDSTGAESLRLALQRQHEVHGTLSLGISLTKDSQLPQQNVANGMTVPATRLFAEALASWQNSQHRFEPQIAALYVDLSGDFFAESSPAQRLQDKDALQRSLFDLQRAGMPLWLQVNPLDQHADLLWQLAEDWTDGVVLHAPPTTDPNQLLTWLEQIPYQGDLPFRLLIEQQAAEFVSTWLDRLTTEPPATPALAKFVRQCHGVLVKAEPQVGQLQEEKPASVPFAESTAAAPEQE